MARKPIKPQKPKTSGVPRWMIAVGALLALVVGVHFLLISQIEQAIGQLSSLTGINGVVTHRGGYYTLGGDVGVSRFRMDLDNDGRSYIIADRFEIDTPGWGWTLRAANPITGESRAFATLLRAMNDAARGNGFSAPNLPPADALHVRLRGFEVELAESMFPGKPKLGLAAGAPFETEGCTAYRYFVPLNLRQELGLAYTETTLSVGYRVTGPENVVQELVLDAPNAMRTSIEQALQVDVAERYARSDVAEQTRLGFTVTFDDRGFIAARNEWCAAEAKVDADEFQRRHITAARRVLEVFGMRMSPETESIYSSFARQGGALSIIAKAPDFASDEPIALKFMRMEPKLQHDDEAAMPLIVEAAPVRLLPLEYGGSVYDMIARGDASAPAPKPAAAAPRAPVSAPAAGPATVPVTVAMAPPAVVRREPPKPIPLELSTEALIAAIGERVEVISVEGHKRQGVIKRVDDEFLVLEQRVPGGRSELSFQRDRIAAVNANPPRQR